MGVFSVSSARLASLVSKAGFRVEINRSCENGYTAHYDDLGCGPSTRRFIDRIVNDIHIVNMTSFVKCGNGPLTLSGH